MELVLLIGSQRYSECVFVPHHCKDHFSRFVRAFVVDPTSHSIFRSQMYEHTKVFQNGHINENILETITEMS